jgi:hypothetical protein
LRFAGLSLGVTALVSFPQPGEESGKCQWHSSLRRGYGKPFPETVKIGSATRSPVLSVGQAQTRGFTAKK